jgi:CheY-like chemotaxis protein
VGKGSRFSISVPITRAGSNPEISVVAAPVDLALGKCILVVDDDPLVLDGMRGILTSWGCRVVTAASVAGALERLADVERLDLIISDFRLGGTQTGINAITQLRASLGKSVPAFLISGDTTPERERDARAHGLTLLHKPVPAPRLRAALTQFLRGPMRAAPGSTHTTQGHAERDLVLPPQ